MQETRNFALAALVSLAAILVAIGSGPDRAYAQDATGPSGVTHPYGAEY